MSKDDFEGGDAVIVVYHQKTLLGKWPVMKFC